jgi:hypothetical protein
MLFMCLLQILGYENLAEIFTYFMGQFHLNF